MTVAARVAAYLAAQSLPLGEPARSRLISVQALIAAEVERPAGMGAAWAAATGGSAKAAQLYLSGHKLWPSKRKSRSPLIVAVETWEAAQPVFNLTQNTMSGLCGDGRVVD